MAEEVYRQGAQHLAAGEYDRATDRFEAASQMDPTMLVARNDLAGVYYLQQDYGKALSIYASILADDPHHANALRGAALCHATQRHYDQSRDMLQKVLDMNRHDARSWLDLGDVNFLAGNTRAAQESWKTAAQATHDPEIDGQAQVRLKAYSAKPTASQPAMASR
jgi:tetratricopeptide (TPR) repeat protein